MKCKKLLIFTVVVLLLGVGIVSATDVDNNPNSIICNQEDTTDVKEIETYDVGKNLKTDISPEIDDYNGVVTTVSTEAVSEYVGEDVQLNATVDRLIPGKRLSEGSIVFQREGVNITDFIPVNDGEASVIVTLEEDWIGTSTLIANYIGTDTIKSSESEPVDFIVIPKVQTLMDVDPVVGYVDTEVQLNATVDSVNPGLKINEGAVYFYTVNRELGVSDVTDGIASINITLSEDLMPFDKIEATYFGRRIYADTTGEATLNILPKVDVAVQVDPVSDYVDTEVELFAAVDSVNPGPRLNEGTITFRINGEDLTEGMDIATVDVINGQATRNIMLTEYMMQYSTITAIFSGTSVYAQASSTEEDFIVIPKVQTLMDVDPVVGYVDTEVQLNATVDSVNPGLKINEGVVVFSTTGRELGVADVINGQAHLNITLSNDLKPFKQLTANYFGRRIYNDSESEPVEFTVLSKDEPVPHNTTPEKITPKSNVKTSVKYSNKVISQSDTHKILVNNNVVYTGNYITLDALNKIFELNLTNGQLVVYLDGEVVFNGTTSDDLSQIIIEILENILGKHEIKIDFTDADGKTNTYKEYVEIR